MHRFMNVVIAFAVPALLLSGCEKENNSPAAEAPEINQGVPAQGQQATTPPQNPVEQPSALSASALTQMRDSFMASANEQVQGLETMIGDLRDKAEASESAQALRAVIDEAETTVTRIKSDLETLRTAATDQIEELSAQIQETILNLQQKLMEAGGIGG